MTEWARHEADPVTQDRVRWHPSDLDRCEHGRHVRDDCGGCIGPNPGNLFLLAPERIPRMDRVRTVDGCVQVRIGTMVRGEPIWVAPSWRPSDHGN